MIFLDTNVVAETMRILPDQNVIGWLVAYDPHIALSTIVLGEIAYGIEKIRPDERSKRLQASFDAWRHRTAGRIFSFDEPSALIYGKMTGKAHREGRAMSLADGMIGAIALRHRARLATRNISHFDATGLALIDPWTESPPDPA